MTKRVITGDMLCRHGTPYVQPCQQCIDAPRLAREQAAAERIKEEIARKEWQRGRPSWLDDGQEVYADDEFIMQCVEFARKRGMI